MSIGGETREGSSVIRMRWRKAHGVFDAAQFRATLWGEAAAIDLGSQGYLFALLKHNDRTRGGLYPEVEFRRAAMGGVSRSAEQREAALREIESRDREYAVSPEHWPTFVRFRDLTDPRSVEEVTPGNFAYRYGEGSSLRRVTMQIVDQPPMQSIEDLLPWLRGLDGSLSGRGILPARGPIFDQLQAINFKIWGVTF